MPFKKGHSGYKGGGRPKGSKKKPSQQNTSLNTYSVHKHWQKKQSRRMPNINDIDHYIYNDLPLDEYYDSLKLSDWKFRFGNAKNTKNDKRNG